MNLQEEIITMKSRSGTSPEEIVSALRRRDEAASAMLAALRHIANDPHADLVSVGEALAVIAQAEAAGITELPNK